MTTTTSGRTLLNVIVGSAAALATSACAGSETGNGARDEKPVKVEMKLVANVEGTFIAPDKSGTEFEITTATTRVDRLDFVLPDGVVCDLEPEDGSVVPYVARCGDDAESSRVKVEGPWDIDLVTGMASPALDMLTLPFGAFDRIEARLRPGGHDDWTLATDGIVGDKSFRLELRMGEVVRFGDKDGAAVTVDDVTAAIGLELDPANWFEELDLAACIASGDVPSEGATLQLHEGSPSKCGNVTAKVESALRASARAKVVKVR